MKRIAQILSMLTLAVLLAASAGAAHAAGWPSIRDRATTLKEQGRFTEAYATATSFTSGKPDALFDREFVAGWIALRSLKRPDVAFKHFHAMATHSVSLPKSEINAGKAKAGYWLGRALRDLGRKRDAETMFAAAARYPTTFYGQLSAAEIGKGITKEQVLPYADSYPVKKFYWHDARADKNFILAVIRQESRFNQKAVSPKNAIGLMQVLDSTALQVGKEAGVKIDPRMMRANPDYNIAVGSRYLADRLERYGGNPMLAAAAYNAGAGRADDWIKRFGDPRGRQVDPVDWAESIPFRETRDYVQKVISNYIVYRALNGK